jgi:hypothetical protein
MRRLIIAALALAAVPLFSAGGSHRYGSYGSHHGMNITTNDWSDDGPVDCSALKVTFDDEPAARAEEELPVASLRTLSVRSDKNGGIHVVGTSDSRFSVRLCKAAALSEDLGRVRASLSGNTVSASGPADESQWMAYFLVSVPRGAHLDLSTHNGGIGLHHVDAEVVARALNGPISIKDSTGTVDAETTNGPISIAGDSGTVKARAQNGPVSVKLTGSTWRGSLDATTQNGPLSVKLGRYYHSGVVIETDGRGPVSCRAEACRQARRTWDDDDNRRIELGDGAQNIHMSTVNGPVSVKEE